MLRPRAFYIHVYLAVGREGCVQPDVADIGDGELSPVLACRAPVARGCTHVFTQEIQPAGLTAARSRKRNSLGPADFTSNLRYLRYAIIVSLVALRTRWTGLIYRGHAAFIPRLVYIRLLRSSRSKRTTNC